MTVVAAVDEHSGRVRVGDSEWSARGGPAASRRARPDHRHRRQLPEGGSRARPSARVTGVRPWPAFELSRRETLTASRQRRRLLSSAGPRRASDAPATGAAQVDRNEPRSGSYRTASRARRRSESTSGRKRICATCSATARLRGQARIAATLKADLARAEIDRHCPRSPSLSAPASRLSEAPIRPRSRVSPCPTATSPSAAGATRLMS